MKTLLFIICLGLTVPITGQIQVSGYVVDKTTQLPIEYANVGIAEKGIGTVCDEQGKFTLTIPHDDALSLTITHLGYATQTIPSQQLNDVAKIKIEMIPETKILHEFTFSGKNTIELGYRPQDDRAKGYFIADGLGMEGGCLIRNTDTVELTHFYMNILELPYDSMKFRLNFYSVNNKQPSEKLNKTDVLMTLRKNNIGVFGLPLSGITVKGDFICTIELVELFGQVAKNVHFTFSAILDKKGVIYKKGISMGKWETIKKYSLSFWFSGKK